MDIQDLIVGTPATLGAVGGIFFIYNYNRLSYLIRTIGWFIVFTVACETYAIFSIDENNLLGLHIYTLGQFIFCSLFFYHLFKLLKWEYFKTGYIYAGIGLIIFNSAFIQNIETYNSYSKTGVQFFVIVLCFTSYYLLTLKDYTYWDKAGVKIFIAAILLNCSISMTIYLFSHQIMQLDILMQRKIWMINIVSNILVQVLYIYALVVMVMVKAKKQFDLE